MRLTYFMSPRATITDEGKDSCPAFGFFWWFWFPRIYNWPPTITKRGWCNARVIRFIWLCFAISLEIGYEGIERNEK